MLNQRPVPEKVRLTCCLAGERFPKALAPLGEVATKRPTALSISATMEASELADGGWVYRALEIDPAPMLVQVSFRCYAELMAYFFPGVPDDTLAEDDSVLLLAAAEQRKSQAKASKAVKLAMPAAWTLGLAIDRMRERATGNRRFEHVKLLSTPVHISYKGEWINLLDSAMVLPTLEYSKRTCGWLDLIAQLRGDLLRAVVDQLPSDTATADQAGKGSPKISARAGHKARGSEPSPPHHQSAQQPQSLAPSGASASARGPSPSLPQSPKLPRSGPATPAPGRSPALSRASPAPLIASAEFTVKDNLAAAAMPLAHVDGRKDGEDGDDDEELDVDDVDDDDHEELFDEDTAGAAHAPTLPQLMVDDDEPFML